jgi:nucleoside-diphosphate-sugar epimerase
VLIFFTGGSGFIGYYFHEVLFNFSLVNYDKVAPSNPLNSSYLQGDVRDISRVSECLPDNSDLIICLAAAHHDFGISEEEYFSVNEEGSKVICKVAEEKNIKKIVYYSSVAVYGEHYNPSKEELEPKPTNPYGASKLAGERVFIQWAKKNSSRTVLIMRPVLVYGPRNRANMFNLIRQIDSGAYFHIGKADNIKSIAYVENLVSSTIQLMNTVQPGVHIYNYADSPHLTSREIAEIIASRLGKKVRFSIPEKVAFSLGLPFDLAINLTGKNLPVSTSRIKKLATQTYHSAEKIINHGVEPLFSNIQGLQKMVDWYNSQKQ